MLYHSYLSIEKNLNPCQLISQHLNMNVSTSQLLHQTDFQQLTIWKASYPKICCVCLQDVALEFAICPSSLPSKIPTYAPEDYKILLTCSNLLCDVVVHPACYGLFYRELCRKNTTENCHPANWLCDKCESINREQISCTACPTKTGALIRIGDDENKWVHVVCYWKHQWAQKTKNQDMKFSDLSRAIRLPSLDSLYGQSLEQSLKLVCCYLCQRVSESLFGTVLKCDQSGCNKYFHATCGHKLGIFINSEVRALCHEHHPNIKFDLNMKPIPNAWSGWALLKPNITEQAIYAIMRSNECVSPAFNKFLNFDQNENYLLRNGQVINVGHQGGICHTPSLVDQPSLLQLYGQNETPIGSKNPALILQSTRRSQRISMKKNFNKKFVETPSQGILNENLQVVETPINFEVDSTLQFSFSDLQSTNSTISQNLVHEASNKRKRPIENEKGLQTPMSKSFHSAERCLQNLSEATSFNLNSETYHHTPMEKKSQGEDFIKINAYNSKTLVNHSNQVIPEVISPCVKDIPESVSEKRMYCPVNTNLFSEDIDTLYDNISPRNENYQPKDYPYLTRQTTRFFNDLYVPLWTRGIGKAKEGMCRLCHPETWFKIKISAYWYHMNFHHGVSQTTGRPYKAPMKERYNMQKKCREGYCHQCHNWINLDSIRQTTVNVPQIYWWKHAQKCHQ